MNPTQQHLIDSYLRNELSEAEHASFENLMASDPAFREEVRFEKHVKEGIGRYRKAELKARLDAIEVSPGWLSVGQLANGTLVKTIGGFVTAGILVTTGYFLLDTTTEEAASNEAITEHIAVNHPEEDRLPVLIIPELIEETETADNADVSEKVIIEEKSTVDSGRKLSVSENDKAGNDKEPVAEEFAPRVHVPGLNEVQSEEADFSADAEIPEASSTDEINSRIAPLDVKTISRKSEIIKYKYFDGKLYLYGDFKNQPYEILEINSSSERSIYVYYNSSYYKVNVTDKVEELPQITHEKLIHELEIIRNNKLAE